MVDSGRQKIKRHRHCPLGEFACGAFRTTIETLGHTATARGRGSERGSLQGEWLRRIAQWLAIGLLFASPVSGQSSSAVAPAKASATATLIELKGPIGPAMSRYVEHSLADAEQSSTAPSSSLQMDTPGGLDTSMRDIIKAILASPVPVVTYVAPSGARAASAGTYILYASHFAAMAPATNLGAATPISIGGEPSAPPATPGQSRATTRSRKAPEEIPAGTAERAQGRQ